LWWVEPEQHVRASHSHHWFDILRSLWSSFRLYPCTSLSGRKNFVGLRKPWSSFPLSFSVLAKNYCTLDTSLLKSGLHVAGGFAAALLYDLPCVVSSVDCGSASYSFRSYSDLSQARPRVANGWISFFLSIKWSDIFLALKPRKQLQDIFLIAFPHCKIWRYVLQEKDISENQATVSSVKTPKNKRKIETSTDRCTRARSQSVPSDLEFARRHEKYTAPTGSDIAFLYTT
jgi:hypothetical protein